MFKKKPHETPEEVIDETTRFTDDNAAEQAQDNASDQAEQAPREESTPKSEQEQAEEDALGIRFMRLQADFANYKKRVEKEKSDIYRNASEQLMTALLPVIDNMERALDHAQESPKEKLIEGVSLVFKNFMDVLQNAGLNEVAAQDLPFDHHVHHAVLTESCEESDSGTVIAVLQKGYKLNEKVIRPTMVKVSE